MQYSIKHRNALFFLLLILLITPSVAFANAGTPLMRAGIAHLLIGNALNGILEAAILALVFRVSYARAVLPMVLANYFSAWLGWFWIQGLSRNQNEIDLYNASRVIWTMFAVTYVATIVLEWPFVAACFWRTPRWLRRSWIASLLIQSVSYLLLFGWYQWASVNSLLTETLIVTPDQIALPSDVRIYFIAEADGDVYTRRLTGGPTQKVSDLHSTDFADCLSLEVIPGDRDRQQLIAIQGTADRVRSKTVQLGITIAIADCPQDAPGLAMFRERFPSPGEGIAAKLGTASASHWSYKAGYWSAQGLWGENSQTGSQIRIALDVPFIQWVVRHPIELPDNLVLFQLGERQICIFDLDTKKLAVIEHGRGAIAVMDVSPSSAQ